MRLRDKILFIAGASGMAAETVRLALKEGAQVFAVDRNLDSINSLRNELLPRAASFETYCADLTEESEVKAAFHQCIKTFGSFDAVFHAVGISGRRFGDGALHACTLAGWHTTHTNNATTAFLVSRAALQYFIARDPIMPANLRGTIVNMASVLAYSPQKDFFATHAYAASKGAVISMTQSAASYYAPYRININAIAPGLVASPMSARAQNDPAILEFIRHKQPLSENLLDPREIAEVVIFLLSDAARNITGQVLAIDGGWCVSD